VSRYQKRKALKETAGIIKKAKIDMQRYFSSLSELPSEKEIKAWQDGYIAGINRANNNVSGRE
jgi:hypothetical protein